MVTPSKKIKNFLRSESMPPRLMNEAVNVCFFNSIMQILISIPSFTDYIMQTHVDNVYVWQIKNLLQKIRATHDDDIVKTSSYLCALKLRNYTFRCQYDAQECLSQIFLNCFTDLNDSLFSFSVHESVLCERDVKLNIIETGCNNKVGKDVTSPILSLAVDNIHDDISVRYLLDKCFSQYGSLAHDYRCELENGGCGKSGHCTKAALLTRVGENFVIHLKIFRSDVQGNSWKIFPNLRIDQNIRLFEMYDLKGIIWHHGNTLDCGHYTASVKYNETWFMTNDSSVTEFEKFSCSSSDLMVPYVLFYKKKSFDEKKYGIAVDSNHESSNQIEFKKNIFRPIITDVEQTEKEAKLERDASRKRKSRAIETYETKWARKKDYENTDFGDNRKFIENICEMHIGLKEKEIGSSNIDCSDEQKELIDNEPVIENDKTVSCSNLNVDTMTTEALDIIQSNQWLDGRSFYKNTSSNLSSYSLPSSYQQEQWKISIKTQSEERLDNLYNVQEEDIAPQHPEESRIIDDEFNNTDFVIERTDEIDFDEISSEISQNFSLNKKQDIAFRLAVSNIIKRKKNENLSQIICYVGGPGGTGKSQIIKAIVKFHDTVNLRHQLRLCAFTGTAAKHIGGSTISSLAGLRTKNNITVLERKWNGVKTILLDEVSMVGCSLLAKFSRNITRAKHSNPDLPFGGVDVIFFGDFIQFPPVRDVALYWNYNQKNMSSSTDNSSIDKNLGSSLWKQVTHVVLLDEQMRVTDKNYQELLNRLRSGKSTYNDYLVLSSRVIGNTNDTNPNSGEPIIVPGNELVRSINNLYITKQSQTSIVYISKAKDSIKKSISDTMLQAINSLPSTKTEGLPGELPLYVGMPVILTKNIYTELGMTNGTTGVVRHIPLKSDEIVQNELGFHQLRFTPDYLVVELNNISLKPLDGLEPSHVPIFPEKGSFSIEGPNGSVSVSRVHFPLVPAFSYTAHKSQGQTLRQVTVDLVPPKGMKNIGISFSYVPLSRVRRLRDLTLLRPFNFSVLSKSVTEDCVAMLKDFEMKDICKDK